MARNSSKKVLNPIGKRTDPPARNQWRSVESRAAHEQRKRSFLASLPKSIRESDERSPLSGLLLRSQAGQIDVAILSGANTVAKAHDVMKQRFGYDHLQRVRNHFSYLVERGFLVRNDRGTYAIVRTVANASRPEPEAENALRKSFDAKVRDLGRSYADGTPNLEINLPKEEAAGLPFQIDQRVSIRLRVAGREYGADLRSTSKHTHVWVGPKLYAHGGERLKLGRVLTDAGFQANDSIHLLLDGPVVEVRAANGNPLQDSSRRSISSNLRRQDVESELAQTAEQLEREHYFEPASIADARKRVLREIAQREGQPGFRRSLIRAYNGQCAVSGCDAVDALEACHIAPYRESQSNRVSNGLLLRADIHTLFDLDLIGIDPDSLRVVLSHRLRMTSYREFDGCRVLVPNDPRLRPDEAALRERWKQFLRGAGAKPLPPRGSVEAVMSSFGAWKMSRKQRDRIQRIIEQDR